MAYFEWADDMVIDGGPIDQDHRVLVDLVNELHSATVRGAGREIVGAILNRCIVTTREHLTREEEYMERMGFPHQVEHKAGNDSFMEKLYDLQRKQEAGSITVAAQLSSTLRDWLSLHIRRNDKELRKFERNRQREAQRHGVAARPAAGLLGKSR